MMKKLALSLTLGAVLLSGSTLAQAVDVGQGMSIYGRLETAQSGCTVLMSKYVLNLNHDYQQLKVQGSQLTHADADEHVNIQLGGKNCDADEGYSNIGLKFLGSVDDVEGNTLANTDTGASAAQGVSVQLTDYDNKLIKPNVTISRFSIAESANGQATTHAATYPLFLTLVGLKGKEATPGSIQTNLTVQIERL